MAFVDPIRDKRNYLDQSILNKARIDKFFLTFTLPEPLRTIDKSIETSVTPNQIISERLSLSVWGIVVPTITVTSVDVPFGGQVPKVTSFSRPAYSPIDVNFTIDSQFYNWNVIYKWLNLLNDSQTSNFDQTGISKQPYPQEKPQFMKRYCSDMLVTALNEYNQKVCEFEYIECFPTSLKGIEFNYQNNNEIQSGFTFEFSKLNFLINT